MHLIEGSVLWWAVVNKAVNVVVAKKMGISFTTCVEEHIRDKSQTNMQAIIFNETFSNKELLVSSSSLST
jgi:hypothetical protein